MRPHRLFAIGTGAYVAGVCATPVLMAGPTGGPVPPVAIAAAVAVVGFAVGWAAARRPSMAAVEATFTRTGPILALFAVPPALLVAAVTAQLVRSAAQSFALGALRPVVAGAGTAFVGALVVAHAAERHRTDRLLAESDVAVRLPGRYTKLRREHGRALVALGVLYGAFVGWLLAASSLDWTTLLVVLGPVPIAAGVIGNPDLVVLEEGLVSGATVEPWSRYERFELTDEYLRLYRDGWGAGRHDLPRDAIEDVDAAVAALSAVLPEGSADPEETGPNGGVPA